jgi:hypothetical protein
MDNKLDLRMLLGESRPRVYLLWAFLTTIGFTATHFYQDPNINIVWIIISIVGLGYMYQVMALRVKQMRQIFLAWLVPISAGIVLSVIAAQTDLLPGLLGYLGSFWLLISAVGYAWNGAVDPPSKWYYIASGVNIIAAAACYYSVSLSQNQYLVAAAVSAWSMLSLWLYRSDA